ncbi:glycosyltransferase family 2 protein [Glaciecola sp. 1036]|uniref:glycosyltransferase family 2 protein n=1 Tax=Alteromonadaceae TaxID=72275 RepID=UPI003D072B0F
MDKNITQFWEQMNDVRNALAEKNYNECKRILANCKQNIGDDNLGRGQLVESLEKLISRKKGVFKPDNKLKNTPVSSIFSSNCFKYSFVTSVFNRFWQLKQTLPTNLATLRNCELSELVVVDFGGSDSAQIAKFIDEHFSFDILSGKLKYFRIKKPWTKFHMAPAKNAAARLSTGEYIISLDADNYINEEDLQNFYANLNNKYSLVHQTTGASPMKHKDWESYNLFEDNVYHNIPLSWDGSCGRIGKSRALFEEVNGYNENFAGMGMDDIDFLIRSIKASAQYEHISLKRDQDEIFIDNGSADTSHEHDDNQINWKLMDETLSKNQFRVEYQSIVPISLFEEFIPECINSTVKTEVTLFSSIFRAGDYIQRFTDDVRDIMTCKQPPTIILMDVVGSHSKETSLGLQTLAKNYDTVYYLPVLKDPGLYECWNIVIKKIRSKFIANLNVDDIRGKNWMSSCLFNLKANLCDVSSPITVPFSDRSINSYDDYIKQKQGGKEFEKWFDVIQKYDFKNNKVSWHNLDAGYYNHENMFQIIDGNRIASFCVPNASAMWRRELHNIIGYFEEEKYGAFTDLVFWLEASRQGFTFKQNNYSALFYLSDTQAHMRQDSNYRKLLQLALQYGSYDLKQLAVSNAFDLSLNDGTYGDHHLLGWNWVRDNVHEKLNHNPEGIYLDLFVERTFFWNPLDPQHQFVFDKPWIAFIHTTPHKSSSFDHKAQNLDCLIEEPRFLESLKLCKGLIVLSQENADYLKRELDQRNVSVPIVTLFHPNIPIQRTDASESGTTAEGKVYHVGWHLRSFSEFAKLDLPKDKKVLLIPGNLDRDYFINDVVNRELAENGLLEIEHYVADMYNASNDEYQDILSHGIVFNHYIQPAGSNLISECISAGTKLVINRHPGFESYLGADYPLFYDSTDEAESLINRLLSIDGLNLMVAEHHSEKEAELSIDSFVIELSMVLMRLLKSANH